MDYEYFCTRCNLKFEIKKPMDEASREERCPNCHNIARRVYSPLNVTWGKGCWQFGEDGLGDEPIHNF